MTTLADIFVPIRADGSKIGPDIRRDVAKADVTGPAKAAGKKAGDGFAAGFGSATKKLVGLAVGALASRELVSGIKSSVAAASDLNETVNKTDVIFGKSSKTIKAWAQNSERALGLSENQALAAASGFGDMFLQIGFTEKAATKMSKAVVKNAADLGSFNNLGTDDVLNRISAALRGEYDSLQAVIPNINAARVEKEALAATGKKVAKNLTAEEKASATLAIIQKDGARAAGDFAKTSGGLANQTKITGALMEELKVSVGKGATPAFLQVRTAINDQVLPALIALSDEHGPKVAAFLEGLGPKVGASLSLLATGDFNGKIRKALGGLEEDSPYVVGLLEIRDGAKSVAAAFDVLVRGDYTNKIFGQTEDSKTVDVLFDIRDAIAGVDDQIKGMDKEKLKETFSSVLDSAEKLLPVVQQFIDEMPGFGTVVDVGAKGLAFLADHADTLSKYMPVLVAAVVAYKLAQLAANAAQVLAVPAKVAEVVVNRQLVKSNRELIASRAGVVASTLGQTGATTANTAATSANAAASGRGRIATIAFAAAQRVAAVATAVATTAWKLLSRAFILSPIGFIITGLTVVVAGIVYLATKTQFFQTVWRVAWGAITKAASATFNWVKQNWPLILGIITGPIGLAVVAVIKNWDKIKEPIKAALRFVLDTFLGFAENILRGADKMLGWVPGVGGKLQGAVAAFSKFRDDVNGKLDGIKDEPVNVKVALAYTKHLGQNPLNTKNFARGGIMPGYTPGRDVHTFMSPTGGVLELSGGEPVLRPEAGRVLGKGWVDGINGAARKGGTSGVRGFLGMARGGILPRALVPSAGQVGAVSAAAAAEVDRFGTALAERIAKNMAATQFNPGLSGVLDFVRTQQGKPYLWGGVGPGGYDCSGLISAAINVARGTNPYRRLGATGSMPWGMFAPGPGAFMVGWFQGNPGHTAGTVNGVNIESRGGQGVVMGAAARGANHPMFTNRMHVAGFARGGLIGDPPFDLLNPRGRNYLGIDLAQAFGRGVLFRDSGGLLPPGTSLVQNNTKRNERVISPKEEAHLKAQQARFQKSLEHFTKAIEQTTSRINDLLTKYRALYDASTSSFTGALFGSGTNVADLGTRLQARKNDANTFRKSLSQLKAKGLNKALWQEIAGSSDYAAAQQLAGMSRADIAKLNAQYVAANKATAAVGHYVANSVYGKQIRDERTVLRKRQDVRDDIKKVLTSITFRLKGEDGKSYRLVTSNG